MQIRSIIGLICHSEGRKLHVRFSMSAWQQSDLHCSGREASADANFVCHAVLASGPCSMPIICTMAQMKNTRNSINYGGPATLLNLAARLRNGGPR